MKVFYQQMRVAVMLAATILTVSGCNVGQYEEPAFTASQVEGDIELRNYAPVIAAEVEVSGERREAISKGFRLIADYIFGNNAPNTKIAMTTPVIQQAEKSQGQSIAMTTPVIQQADGANWKVQFILPAEYTLANLPKPNNKAVKLREVKGRRMAVIRFSGPTNDDARITEKTAALRAYVQAHHLRTVGEPVLAFYDPPWTLWFMRRNEVMLEVKG
ncbi:MAG: SOUL family heme-binding protein [Rickettsiales bacterium]